MIKAIIAPLASLIILIFGSGFFITYLTIRLQIEGYGTEVAGYVTAAYYVGLFMGSFTSEKFISRLGLIKSYAIFAFLIALISLVQGIYISPLSWIILRLVGGF